MRKGCSHQNLLEQFQWYQRAYHTHPLDPFLYFYLLILFTDDGITIFFNLEQLLNSSPSESVELYNTDCILNSVHPSLILSSVLF